MDGMDVGKNNRVLFLYSRLLEGQKLRKSKLTEEFWVSDKSIHRDFESIRDFLDKENVEEGDKIRLVYDYKEKTYYLEQDNGLNLSNGEIFAISKILLENCAFTRRKMDCILDKLVVNCELRENRILVNKLLGNEKFHYMEL